MSITEDSYINPNPWEVANTRTVRRLNWKPGDVVFHFSRISEATQIAEQLNELDRVFDENAQLQAVLESLMMGCINGGYHPSPSLREAFTLLGGYKAYPWLRDLRLPLPDDEAPNE